VVIAEENAFSSLANFLLVELQGETQLSSVFKSQSCRQTRMSTFSEKQLIEMISQACRDVIVSV